MSLRSVALRLLQDTLKGNDAEKLLGKLGDIDNLITHVPRNSIQSGFSQLDRNVRLAMLDGLHDVIKLAKTPEIKAAVARDYMETFRKNFSEGPAGQQAFNKFQTEFATELDKHMRSTSVEVAKPKGSAPNPKGKPDDPNMVDAEIVPPGSKKPSSTAKAKPIDVKPVVLNFIDEMTNHTLRGKDSSAIKSAFKDLRALLSENHPELLVTKLETPRENTLKPAAIIKNIRDGRPVTRDELNKAETLYITRAENKVAADVAAARKAETEAEAARKAEADAAAARKAETEAAAARKAETEAAAARKAEADAAAARKAEEDRLLAEKQAGARAAMIGDINSIMTENVPNPEQLKSKFVEMRKVLGEQGLLDSSPRFTPSNMNPDDLAKALAEGRQIHVDDISNVERRLLSDIDQVAKEASRVNAAEAENIAKTARARALPENIGVLHATATAKKRVEIENLPEKLADIKQHLLDEGRISSHIPYASRVTTPNDVLQKIIGGDPITVGEWALFETHMKTWHSKINPQEIASPPQNPQGFMGQASAKMSFFQGARDFLTEQKRERNAEAHLEAFFGKTEYNKTKSLLSRHPLTTAATVSLSLGLLVWNGLDSEKDDFDNGLSPMQRIGYNFQKARMSLTPTGTVFGVKFGDDLANDVLSNTSNDPLKLALKSSVRATRNVAIDKEKDQGEKVVGQTQASAMSAPAPVLKGLFTRSADSTEAAKNIPETIDKMAEEFDINDQEASQLKKAWQSAAQKTDSSEAFREQAQKILSESSLHRAPENVNQLVQRLGM
ncbi:MAG: hypothetical protein JNL76_08075 [Alphaproteobacteria bacterium]|nr:hypothetical protein [Alphaproteobacteria bacterium]